MKSYIEKLSYFIVSLFICIIFTGCKAGSSSGSAFYGICFTLAASLTLVLTAGLILRNFNPDLDKNTNSNSRLFSSETSPKNTLPEFANFKEKTGNKNNEIAVDFQLQRKTGIAHLMVCKHPVTKHEYYRFCKDSGKKTANLKNGNSPACGINWYDAIVYCNLRSIAENLTPVYRINNNTNPAKWNEIESASSEEGTKYCGPSLPIIEWDEVSMNIAADGYRLPTEAEWIHLAHNSDKTACKFADGLWEWCYDWCGSVNGEKDGIELNMGFDRILRTISFDNGSLSQIQTAQHKDYPDSRDRDFGFRVVRTVV